MDPDEDSEGRRDDAPNDRVTDSRSGQVDLESQSDDIEKVESNEEIEMNSIDQAQAGVEDNNFVDEEDGTTTDEDIDDWLSSSDETTTDEEVDEIMESLDSGFRSISRPKIKYQRIRRFWYHAQRTSYMSIRKNSNRSRGRKDFCDQIGRQGFSY